MLFNKERICVYFIMVKTKGLLDNLLIKVEENHL